MTDKKILYIDMDGVVVDFESGINKISEENKIKYLGQYDNTPGIFKLMEPMPGAIDSINQLSEYYNLYILSTAPWDNPNAWCDKLKWIKKYFGKDKNNILYKKLILTHHKDLQIGDILIDDRPNNGADKFNGRFIKFGSEEFTNWDSITKCLIDKK